MNRTYKIFLAWSLIGLTLWVLEGLTPWEILGNLAVLSLGFNLILYALHRRRKLRDLEGEASR